MRTLTPDRLSYQASSNRKPTGDVIIRDVMLRFKELTASGYNFCYPAATAGANSVPQCPIDILDYGSQIQRAWMDDYPRIVYSVCSDPSSAAVWVTPTLQSIYYYVGPSEGPDAQHRISLAGRRMYYGRDGDINYRTLYTSHPWVGDRSVVRANA